MVQPVAGLTPVVDPVVRPIGAAVAGDELPVSHAVVAVLGRPAHPAKTLPPQQETTPSARPAATQYRPCTPPDLSAGPPAVAKTGSQPTHATTASSQKHAPGDAPEPARRSPAPADAACGTNPTVPPGFLTPGHGPRATRTFMPPHGDFVPLWRACEPGTGPG